MFLPRRNAKRISSGNVGLPCAYRRRVIFAGRREFAFFFGYSGLIKTVAALLLHSSGRGLP